MIRYEFGAQVPNQLWLADITPQTRGAPSEHWTGEGKLYLCAINDVDFKRIVGYSVNARMKSRLAVEAVSRRQHAGRTVASCVLHTDRGAQFRSRKFVHAIKRHDVAGSMNRVWGGRGW